MSINETITLDPNEFATTRTELGLDSLGFSVRDANWGDADMELFYARQALGEIPADRHPPNRAVSITLDVKGEGAIDFPTAAAKLQQKVGLIQDEGGWVRRDLKNAGLPGAFRIPVAYRLYNATLSGLDGWHMLHRDRAPDVALTLTASPYCYGTAEEVLTDHAETTAKELIFTESVIKGSAPGIFRCTIDNDQAAPADWRGVLLAAESRDYSSASTAALAYECEALTPLGGGAIATLTGASGGGSNNVILTQALSSKATAVLSSQILSGSAHMTHKGTRRMIFRIYDPTATPGTIEFALEYRVLGTSQWQRNDAVRTKVANSQFSLLDVGEVRLPSAVLGSQRWEWRLTARSYSGSGQTPRLDKVWIVPTEIYSKATRPLEVATPTTLAIMSEMGTESGVITTDALALGGSWTAVALSDTDDWTKTAVTGGSTARRTVAGVDTGTVAPGTRFSAGRILTAGTTNYTDIGFSVYFDLSGANFADKGGMVLRFVDAANFLVASYDFDFDGVPNVYVDKVVAGVQTNLATFPRLATGAKVITALVFSTGFYYVGFADAPYGVYPPTPVTLQARGTFMGSDPVLATSGVLASGKVGIGAKQGGAGQHNFSYVYGWVPSSPGLVAASRSMEFRSDGAHAQHATDDVWGRPLEEGFLPYAPPSRLEARPARFLVLPSRGDFDVLPDSAIDDLSARIRYFPGYHFASEAT
jgi:hypothetical protein